MTKPNQGPVTETGRTQEGKPAQESAQPAGTTQSGGTPQSGAAQQSGGPAQSGGTPQTKSPEPTVRPEAKTISSILSSYIADTDTLNGKYNLLRKLRATLDTYLNNPQAYLVEIGSVSTTINDLKKEIAQMEAEQRRDEPPPTVPVRVLYDTQSILSTSSVRRKPDNYAYMEIPRPEEKKSYK